MTKMNGFMNALYGAVGSMITGRWNGHDFLGHISNVREKAGKDLSVSVQFCEDTVKKTGYDGILISGQTIFEGGDAVFKNLHVYFD